MDKFDIFMELDNLLKDEKLLSREEDINKSMSREIDSRGVRAPNTNKNKEDKEKLNDKKGKEDVAEDEDLDLQDEENEDESSEERDLKKRSEIKDISDALNFKKLIKALNHFRSSHSLTDPDVKEDLNNLFEKLSNDEKKALYVFIKALIRVSTPAFYADDTKLLKDFGLRVSSSNISSSKKTKIKKDNVDAEETNISPIKVESIQDKTDIYNFLIENR